jgi:hypothetical protein
MPDFKSALLYVLVDGIIDFGSVSLRFIISAYENDLLLDSGPITDLLVDAHCKCWRAEPAEDPDPEFELIDQLPIVLSEEYSSGTVNWTKGIEALSRQYY